MRAKVGVTESHKEPERDRENSSKSQREPVRESLREQIRARMGVTESHKEPKRG